MWPMFVDYSDEECKSNLRSLELEAYSSIINAFRAQGTLTKDRKKMLQELCTALSISMERHRAEVRRAVNDEHLNTIAERLFGPNTATEWAIEGRRVVPLMQRLAPQTVFTEIANSAASAQAAKNAALPHPGKTGSREIPNGIETMASRKRKDFPSDSSVSPQKLSAMDTQYFHNLLPFDSTISEPSPVPDVPMSSESFSLPEVNPLVSTSFTDLNASRNITPSLANPMSAVSPSKSSSKHPVPKPTSTVTTFSSFDQMTSNLLASRAAQAPVVPAMLHEEQVLTLSDVSKPSSDLKSAQRSLSSHSSMKSSTIVIPTPSSAACSPPTSKDRLQTLPCASQSNKFLTQIRSKNPSHTRQNLPAGLGIKLSPQSHMSQRATVSPKSPMKAKQDNSNIFTKKTSPNVFPTSSASDNPSSQLPTNESSNTAPKSAVPKSAPRTECQTTLNAKQQTVAKSLPKTTAHSSQYISRSLFSTSNKSGAKNLSPVIFNVSSTSCTPLQTAAKTTGAAQSETGKTTQQLLPKSTTVGIGPSHLKINTSNTQTIQYRNDGGLVRSARIVNISQPVGSRLPCAISPSAISALGLSTNLSSTALRVTLPAGTLNTSSAIRVSAAAKPNVIVVHKAQMWPRTQQGAAVIMSSAPLSKLSNDVQETLSITQKQDKSKPSGSKPTPRTIAPVRPQSPAVSVASGKVSESSAVSNPSITTTPQPDSSTSEAHNSKSSENTSEAQCKKNLLADIMEASGILLENTARNKAFLKEKSNVVKNNKELSNHQEPEIISQKASVSSSTSEATPTRLSESNVSKTEAANNSSGNIALTLLPVERNGVDTQKPGSAQAQSVETQSKEACNIVVSSSHIANESVTSSSECGSKTQQEVTKDKDS